MVTDEISEIETRNAEAMTSLANVFAFNKHEDWDCPSGYGCNMGGEVPKCYRRAMRGDSQRMVCFASDQARLRGLLDFYGASTAHINLGSIPTEPFCWLRPAWHD